MIPWIGCVLFFCLWLRAQTQAAYWRDEWRLSEQVIDNISDSWAELRERCHGLARQRDALIYERDELLAELSPADSGLGDKLPPT